MAGGGGREDPEWCCTDGQVERHGREAEVATRGQAAEKPQEGDRAMGPLSPCLVVFMSWDSTAALGCLIV